MGFLKRILQEEYPYLLAFPAIIWQIFFLYIPLLVIFIFSFRDYSESYGFIGWTFSHYERILKPIYLHVVFNSFYLAFATAVICMFIAYPVAYFLAFRVRRLKMFFLFLLVLPSWTNIIVEVYAWFFLLEKRGLISRVLYSLNIISQPLHMVNNTFSVLLGMIYCFLPFMILPIYIILEKTDRKLFEASADLGASKFVTFRRVIFPLSLPGMYTGFLLVFVPAFGEFAVPALLGGAKKAFWGTVIVDKFLLLREWETGFAFASAGILFLLLFFLFVYVFVLISKKIFKNRFSMRIEE
ncbi:MAG: Spermidine/putrescine transport system permease protein potB [candidate division TM6 bacterium GW2011_GWE2_31_21]|nr:MAG: Spermidine/putrescine transport system permease protein potB [candidate division TM6 bacterium GW2011_GWE2_31_21]KKP53097.1 MAG: Spermidine/putrescine transport system permease protein potB [candidate division TM6 bacterium GW2011_GWF2_33_332]